MLDACTHLGALLETDAPARGAARVPVALGALGSEPHHGPQDMVRDRLLANACPDFTCACMRACFPHRTRLHACA